MTFHRQSKCALFGAAVALGAGARAAGAQSEKPPLDPWRVAAEVAAGTVTTPVAFIASGVATKWTAEHLGADDEWASRFATAGAWTGAALATAAVPTLIGTRGRTDGSYGAALAGTLAGGAASWAIIRLMNRNDDEHRPCHFVCVVASVAVFTLPAVGATVGFNLSREYDSAP
jgi:hypothetical protein